MNSGDFFAMGGYARFVWPCFAIVIAILIGNVLSARRLHRLAREAALRRLEAGQGKA